MATMLEDDCTECVTSNIDRNIKGSKLKENRE